jgi:predicted acylesterase/phospholipase RssA
MARSLNDHLFGAGPKRVLAIDGGGARGILACGILKGIENRLRDRVPGGEEQRRAFRLHHYYDLIGGTSTGSILAAGLAIGLSVDDLKQLYLSLCPKIFAPTKVKGVKKPRFDAKKLASELDRVLRERDGRALPLDLTGKPGEGNLITLGSTALHTGFAVFAKRINKGSAWTLTNNPRWRYFDDAAARDYVKRMGLQFFPSEPNSSFPIARLVQASAAAPTYFETVGIDVEADREGSRGIQIKDVDQNAVFVDGALSGRNTPALQMLFMASHPAFGFEWKTGEDNLMITSVGTGWWRPMVTDQTVALNPFHTQAREAFRAVDTLQTLIHDSSLHALTMLQSMSRHPLQREKRWTIDGEVDELTIDGGAPYLLTKEPLLRFRRLDVRLDDKSLQSLFGRSLEAEAAAEGLNVKIVDKEDQKRFEARAKAWSQSLLTMRLRELAESDTNVLQLLYRIGLRYGETAIDNDDFPAGFDPAGMGNPDGGDTAVVRG